MKQSLTHFKSTLPAKICQLTILAFAAGWLVACRGGPHTDSYAVTGWLTDRIDTLFFVLLLLRRIIITVVAELIRGVFEYVDAILERTRDFLLDMQQSADKLREKATDVWNAFVGFIDTLFK